MTTEQSKRYSFRGNRTHVFFFPDSYITTILERSVCALLCVSVLCQKENTSDITPANSPDLNPLDYSIWDEVASRINWKKITSKQTLIYELKRPVHRIRSEVVFESCSSWTVRLFQLSTNNGEYIS